jgi:hypothetical protein
MIKVIPPKQRRTIEVAMCPFCDRRFVYASRTEIEGHIGIERDNPFQTGMVYVSNRGYNIITPMGRLMDGTEFGGYMTHTYRHWIATCKRPIEQELEFEEFLKARGVKELKERFRKQQIWLPTPKESRILLENYRNYLENPDTDRNSQVWNALKDLKPEELARIDDTLRIPGLVLSA